MPAASAPTISPGDYAGQMGGVATPEMNPTALKRLWTAVIIQALQDAIIDGHKIGGTLLRDARDAISWLLFPTSDYRAACSFAGLDAMKLRESSVKKLGPLAALYRAKANDLLRSDVDKDRKLGVKYNATAELIERGCK